VDLIRKFFDTFDAEVKRAAADYGVVVNEAPKFGESPTFLWQIGAENSPTVGSVMLYDAEMLRLLGQIGWNETVEKMARERVSTVANTILANRPRKAAA
jgi:hypothetical protein